MKRIKNILTIAAFSLIMLGLPAIASAQWGNGGYGNGGYYGDIRSTVQDLKYRARNFEIMVDRDKNVDRYEKDAYKDLKRMLDRFTSATRKLEDKYSRGRDLGSSADVARSVIDLGTQIENLMYNIRQGRYWQGEWSQISNDLRIVGNTYGYNYYGNGRNNRGNRNGTWGNRNGNRRNLPSWWPF